MRNRRWSRENVTINQVWQRRRDRQTYQVCQCHHTDELIELVRTDDPTGNDAIAVGTGTLRKYWERVS